MKVPYQLIFNLRTYPGIQKERVGYKAKFSPMRYFPYLPEIWKHCLPTEYHVNVALV